MPDLSTVFLATSLTVLYGGSLVKLINECFVISWNQKQDIITADENLIKRLKAALARKDFLKYHSSDPIKTITMTKSLKFYNSNNEQGKKIINGMNLLKFFSKELLDVKRIELNDSLTKVFKMKLSVNDELDLKLGELKAIPIFEPLFSNCITLFAFDNSTNALVASKMDLKPGGGRAVKMRDIVYGSDNPYRSTKRNL
ncbi:2130_t:CDS:2 [Entrophospora sp. SA101]|nr:2130_t:CDS:2 [Entrophospora sp. SA101]